MVRLNDCANRKDEASDEQGAKNKTRYQKISDIAFGVRKWMEPTTQVAIGNNKMSERITGTVPYESKDETYDSSCQKTEIEEAPKAQYTLRAHDDNVV